MPCTIQIMRKEFEGIYKTLENIINEDIIAPLISKIDKSIDFQSQFKAILDDYFETLSKQGAKLSVATLVKTTRKLKQNLYEQKKENKLIFKTFSEIFESYENNFGKFANGLPYKTQRIQGKERFIIVFDDNDFVKLVKPIKKLLFGISQMPVRVSNLFRTFLNKETKQFRIWRHTIPYENLMLFHFRAGFVQQLIPIIGKVLASEIQVLSSIIDIEHRLERQVKMCRETNDVSHIFNFEYSELFIQIQNDLFVLKSQTNQLIIRASNKTFEAFAKNFEIAGTIELPKWNFSKRKIRKEIKKTNKLTTKLFRGWAIANYAINDNRLFEKELYSIKYLLLDEHYNTINNWTNHIKHDILPELDLVTIFLNNLKRHIETTSSTDKQLKSLLVSLKFEIQGQLSSAILQRLIDSMLEYNIPEKIDRLEVKLNRGIAQISDKRAINKSNTYSGSLKMKDLTFISPNELFSFEAFPEFIITTKSIKSRLVNQIDIIQRAIKEIGQIAEYNIDSAITITEKGETDYDIVKSIALEGIIRAITKTAEIKDKELEINKKKGDELYEAVKKFSARLMVFVNTEDIIRMKFRIARAKTNEQTKRFRKNLIGYITNLIPNILNSIREFASRILGVHATFRKKLGLVQSRQMISTDIANFLAETETAIEKLPYIYQRLFKPQELKDTTFVAGRETETNQLIIAYKNWQKGRFAPVCVIGEQGSGTSTLLETFINQTDIPYPIKKIQLCNTITEKDEFINLLSSLFTDSNINSYEALVRHISDLPSRKIFIIEKIHNLFLRKVTGFNCIKLLFDLISQTGRKIFWLTSCTIYSWEYLNKTIQIEDYFAYTIKLTELSAETIKNIILKRHRVSGYDIFFQIPKHLRNNKKYKKLNDEEKQEFLQEEYFEYLNNYAKSNLSLAFLFWLRSTQKIEGNRITIAQLRQIDYSFLNTLNNDKIFTLHAILIHERLNIENHMNIFDCSEHKSKAVLNLLFDDGIIVTDNNYYRINPLLYRQIVNMLKSKNFVH